MFNSIFYSSKKEIAESLASKIKLSKFGIEKTVLGLKEVFKEVLKKEVTNNGNCSKSIFKQ